ncbi:putative membrane protein [Tenacibaculum sp. MAR_2009_124]|uniref:DUF368 domain-containing protein n=1 Tax=Tenacibaculum sp. MAR_2009_124 TaxID=1250059 RepID=UPI00089AB473|nr:DUF368 domain-containing protein [Tenacibaculum sp. MAR_2009_124]SEB75735.1 putative membrane protein [Tenacibaculum sp. MAR_2009_124]
MSRSLKDYLVIGLKGIAMGAADVVPGVSGGTIAFISGIYEELLTSISNINLGLFKTLKKEGLKKAWEKLNGNFLLALFIGILTSVFSLANAIKWLLKNEPVLLWAFFFGLVLASILYIGKQVEKWNLTGVVLGVLGVVLGYVITIVPSIGGQEAGYLFLIFSGALASCAMILPGISGSYILLLIGVYPLVMKALSDRDLVLISVIAVGVIIGLTTFSKLLKWLFLNYKNEMLISLTGIMLGSLNKVWPWKKVLTTYIDRHGEAKPLLEKSVLPYNYDGDPQLFYAIALSVLGFSLIILLEKIATKKQ